MLDAVVAGHLCLDIIPHSEGEVRLEPGSMTSVGGTTFATGGGVANVGLSLLKLGVDTRLIGQVGRDGFGEQVKSVLRSHDPRAADGITTSDTCATSYTVVINPPGVDRCFLHHPGCNDSLSAASLNLDGLEPRLFYFGYPPLMRGIYEDGGAGLAALFSDLREKGVTTALDMSLPDAGGPTGTIDWHLFLQRVLPHTDVFFPSLPEMLFMLERESFENGEWQDVPVPAPFFYDLAEQLLDMGAGIVGLKLGEDGLYLRTADEDRSGQVGRAFSQPSAWAKQEYWSPVFEVEVGGTVGAGDASLAGFLAGVLRGLSPDEALTLACAVGACSVEAADAVSGVQSWETTQSRVDGGWARAFSGTLLGWQRMSSGVYRKEER